MSRASHLLKKFGITEEQYDVLLRKQDGCCAVCLRPAAGFAKRLCVDHDHFTGQIRGLLCTHCNRYVVGKHRIGKGEELLFNAYSYLIAKYPGWAVPPKVKKRKRRGKAKRNRKL